MNSQTFVLLSYLEYLKKNSKKIQKGIPISAILDELSALSDTPITKDAIETTLQNNPKFKEFTVSDDKILLSPQPEPTEPEELSSLETPDEQEPALDELEPDSDWDTSSAAAPATPELETPEPKKPSPRDIVGRMASRSSLRRR